MNSRTSLIARAALAAFALCLSAVAPAQSWPAKPIRVIVPFPPGGYPGFEAVTWSGIVAPAGTSADIVAKLNAEIAKTLARADFLARLSAEGSEPLGGSPQHFGEFLRAEHAKWGVAVRASGAKVD